MKIYIAKVILVFFICFVSLTTIVDADTSITVEINGIVTSINVKTPNGGTVSNDLSTVIEAGQSVYATYTFNLPAVDYSSDPNVGFYRSATINFRVSINKGEFVWDSTGASIQVDSIARCDRLIIITGDPIAPVTGTLVFGNIPSYQLVYGEEPYIGDFLNNKTDIPSSISLGLAGSIVVQYNDINDGNEFVDTDILFTTTSVSACYGTKGIVKGDLDDDGELGLSDVIGILKVLTGH